MLYRKQQTIFALDLTCFEKLSPDLCNVTWEQNTTPPRSEPESEADSNFPPVDDDAASRGSSGDLLSGSDLDRTFVILVNRKIGQEILPKF